MIEKDIKKLLQLNENSREHNPKDYEQGINESMKGHEPRNYREKGD